ARAPKTSASGATSKAASCWDSLSLPAIVFHHKARHRLDLLLLEQKALALVPAPGFLVLTHAAQDDLIRQMRSRKGQQLSSQRAALIMRRDEQLIEIELWQIQREHGCQPAAVIGNKQAPASLDLLWDTGAQLRQQ